jgi:hypothetical protein
MKRKLKRRNKVKFTVAFKEAKSFTDYFPHSRISLICRGYSGRGIMLRMAD